MIERRLSLPREAVPMPKRHLRIGAYYVGVCRNANVARWDGEQFHYWREKWGQRFVETIRHREDDDVFDVFDAWAEVKPSEVAEIPFEDK